jgi:PAS domain S-box-containing protein/putative nucleotidyltransferase with HDIG domain
MSKPLRVLLVEDSEDDALLVIRELKKGGYDPVYDRVETAEAMHTALSEKTWDVILCDYKLPRFSGLDALNLYQERGIDIPFIIVSGAIGEETAVECMKAGALDYVMKNRLSRLVPAIERELKEAESRLQRKRAEEALRDSEEKYRLVVDNAGDAIIVAQDGILKFVNPATIKLFGHPGETLLSKPFMEFIHPEDRDMLYERYTKRMRGEAVSSVYSFRIMALDGSVKWVEIRAALIPWEGKPATLNFLRDITLQNQVEEYRIQSFERLRKAVGATVHAMSVAVETRDPYTAGHQRRVADLARAIATELGLSGERIDGLRMAGVIHDIGKISIPAEILSKPTRLTEIEFQLIKTHSQSGYDILKEIEFPWPIARIVLEHHERTDGSGYPNGLTGENLLMESKILAIADVVEAIASHRPYRAGLGMDAALDEITKNRAILYDAAAVEACLKLFKEKGYRFE